MLHGKEIIVRVPEDCELHGTIARRHCPAVDTLAANAELRLSTFTISSMREYISDMQLLGATTEGRIDSMASSAVAALIGQGTDLATHGLR